MNTSQATSLHNNPLQSGENNFYQPISINDGVMTLALQEGSLGAHISTSSSCAVNNTPLLIIEYTQNTVAPTGDYNMDGLINVTDIVGTVNIVLGINDYNASVDMNSDEIINVLDIVGIVNIILGN